MNLQIETLTLANGEKVEAIRDIEKVRQLLEASQALREYLQSKSCMRYGFDVPDSIWLPFTSVTE